MSSCQKNTKLFTKEKERKKGKKKFKVANLPKLPQVRELDQRGTDRLFGQMCQCFLESVEDAIGIYVDVRVSNTRRYFTAAKLTVTTEFSGDSVSFDMLQSIDSCTTVASMTRLCTFIFPKHIWMHI